MFGEDFTPRVGQSDGHVAVVDLDLLDGSLGAELSDGAKIFRYVDNDAVVARLTGQGLPHVSHGTGQLHCSLVGRSDSPGHVAQRSREAGRERRNRQVGRSLWAVFEMTTHWYKSTLQSVHQNGWPPFGQGKERLDTVRKSY